MKKILFIGASNSRMPDKGLFVESLKTLGELKLVLNAEKMPDSERARLIRECNILLLMWGAMPVPVEIAQDRGNLEYICNITGELKHMVPLEIIEAGIPVTNWGTAPAEWIAEGAMTLLLGALKDLNAQTATVKSDGWRVAPGRYPGGTLRGLDIGIYGLGAIGQRFLELLLPFHPIVRIYDPYLKDVPSGCTRVSTLNELFSNSSAIVIHAALSDETRNSVTAELLAKLPDKGIVINTARGAIIDQEALFQELLSGRLRAGLDVLEPDALPLGHPARKLDNVIFTAHNISRRNWNDSPDRMQIYEEICIANLKRHINGEPLQFLMDKTRYLRST